MLSIKEINLLEAQNEGLKKQNADLQKENAKLKQEIKEVKKYQYEQEYLDKEIAELQAENERLKEDYIKLYQQKDLDNVRWQKRCTDLHIEDKAKADKYWLVLQEIKGVVTALYMNNWLQMNETARKSIQLLQELITKTESEVE